MKKLILMLVCLCSLVACDNASRMLDCVDGCSDLRGADGQSVKGDKGDVGATGPQGPAGQNGQDGQDLTAPPVTEIDDLVNAENDYRYFQGLPPLTKGLVCSLYTVPNGTASINGASLTHKLNYTYEGVFNQPDSPVSSGLNILPVGLRPLYTSWFVVRCTGKLVVTESDFYQFDLSSDDGSRLYIQGTLLINNDGNHAVTKLTGTKLLPRGVHDFKLEYMQGPAGNQALILEVNGALLPSINLFH